MSEDFVLGADRKIEFRHDRHSIQRALTGQADLIETACENRNNRSSTPGQDQSTGSDIPEVQSMRTSWESADRPRTKTSGLQ